MNISKKLTTTKLVFYSLLLSFFLLAPHSYAKEQARIYDIGTYVTDLAQTERFYVEVFGLKVVRRWDSMEVSLDGKNYQTIELKGLYLQGKNGMHLEFLQKAKVSARQTIQQPINHYALEVKDVAETLKMALAQGASEAFPNTPLQYIKLQGLSVLNTQIIGLDGERIQILQILSNTKN